MTIWTADTAGNTRFTGAEFSGNTVYKDVAVEACTSTPSTGLLKTNKGQAVTFSITPGSALYTGMKVYWIENTSPLKGFGFTKTGTASTFLTDGTTTVAVTPTILTGSSKRIHVAIPVKSGSTNWLIPKATKLTL